MKFEADNYGLATKKVLPFAVVLAEVSSHDIIPRTGSCTFAHRYTISHLVHCIFQQDRAMLNIVLQLTVILLARKVIACINFLETRFIHTKWVQTVHY